MAELYTYVGTRIATDVEDKFGDAGNVQITREMVLRWVNDGIRHIVQANPFLKLTAQTNLVAGQDAYTLSSAFPSARIHSIHSITVEGRPLEIVPFAEYQGNVGAASLEDAAGTAKWATIWGDTVTIWPVPSTSVINGINIYFSAYPAEVTDLALTLPLPDRLFNALNDYVFAQALELDKNFDAAAAKRAHAEDNIRRQAEQENKSPTDFYPAMIADPDDDDSRYY